MHKKNICEFVLNNVKYSAVCVYRDVFFPLLQGPYMPLAVINIFILRYSLTGGHHKRGVGGKGGEREEYFPGAGNNMNCHYDEALKNVTYLRYILIKRFRYELNIKISDDDTCVMRDTATSSDARQNEGPKLSFRKSRYVWRVVSCVVTQCPVYGVPPITVFIMGCPV